MFWCILNGMFCPCPRQKNVEFPLDRSGDLVDVVDVLLGSSVRVMGLMSFLLHCKASNLTLEILKYDKIWGQLN